MLLAFLERTTEVENFLKEFREVLKHRLGVPVIVHYGPRCFDQYAYLLQTGLPPALCIVLTTEYLVDMSIPGANYTFSQLHAALALGEFESMIQSEQPAMRLNFVGELSESMANLKHVLDKALPCKQ